MKKRDSKKGISVMIGYVLLIVIAVFMSTGIYLWVKLYVPSEVPECSEGVSLFLEKIECRSFVDLKITLKNNGIFSVAGYYIYVANDSNQRIADLDLSSNITFGGQNMNNWIRFSSTINNSLVPGNSTQSTFQISEDVSLVQIIPTRYEEVDNKLHLVSCGDSKIEETNIKCT